MYMHVLSLYIYIYINCDAPSAITQGPRSKLRKHKSGFAKLRGELCEHIGVSSNKQWVSSSPLPLFRCPAGLCR